MLAVISKKEREDLYEEIFNTLRHWPERDRKIFSLAHYRGQSTRTIARSLKLELKEVHTVLQQCERGLRDSLRDFRDSSSAKSPVISNDAVRLADREQNIKAGHAHNSRIRRIPHSSRIPA